MVDWKFLRASKNFFPNSQIESSGRPRTRVGEAAKVIRPAAAPSDPKLHRLSTISLALLRPNYRVLLHPIARSPVNLPLPVRMHILLLSSFVVFERSSLRSVKYVG